MPTKVLPFELHFEIIFLENYSRLKPSERKAIDKAIRFLRTNPRHPSLNVHKAKNVKGKYVEGGNDIFIAYASKNLRFTLLRRKPRSLRPWMNAWRVPYEAHTSVVGYASEGSALRSMWSPHGLQPVGAPLSSTTLNPA